MRKLKQIIRLNDEVKGIEHGLPLVNQQLMALDDNGELWHGTLEITDDERRVIDWTPVNTPKDGAAFTEPQLDFFDKWEREAHARIQTEIDRTRKDVPLASHESHDARAIGEEAEDSSGDCVEDGEGAESVKRKGAQAD